MNKKSIDNVIKMFFLSPSIISLVYTIFTLGVFLCTEPQMSIAGDKNITEFLMSSEKIESGFFFISPVLASCLRFFNSIVQANWWALFSVGITFVGLWIFLWFLNKRIQEQSWSIKLFSSTLFIFIMWQLILSEDVNFTQTTTIASLAGFCLILDGVIVNAKKISARILAGLFLLLLAGEIRWTALLMTLPFEIMVLGYYFIFPIKDKNIVRTLIEAFRQKRVVWLSMLVVILAVGTSYGLGEFYQIINPDLKAYKEANAGRENICDYAERYVPYEDAPEMYEAAGLKESWIDMAMGFITSDKNHFLIEDLQKMIDLRLPSKSTVNDYAVMFAGQEVLYVLVSILIIGSIFWGGWKNCIFPAVGCFIGFIGCSTYFIHIGRFPWRVIVSCILSCVISYMLMVLYPAVGKISCERIKKVNVEVGLYVATFLMVVLGIFIVKEQKDFSFPTSEIVNGNGASILNYIDKDEKNVYLYLDQTLLRFVDTHNIWSSHEPDYLDNFFPLITGFILGCSDKLEEYGITDVYNNMLDYSNIRVVYSKSCTNVFYNYLAEFYDKCVSVARVDMIGERAILRYSRPIMSEKEEKYSVLATINEGTYYDVNKDVYASYEIQCEFADELDSKYDDYYINIKDVESNELYSYPMTINEDKIATEVLCIKDTWNPENVKVTLVGKHINEKGIQLADITQEFNETVRTTCDNNIVLSSAGKTWGK